MTLSEAYNYGVYFLSANGVDEAEFKSMCLACSLCGIKNNEFLMHKNDDVIMKRFADLLWRVKSGEPLQYVLGKWDFYNYEFSVGKGVLIPRPETEELVETALSSIKDKPSPVVLDLCSGSGCIGISIARERPDCSVYCVELFDEALAYLNKNAQNDKNVKIIKADVLQNPDESILPLKADLIASNPPYIKRNEISSLQDEVQQEPISALDGGEDGLDFYRSIISKWLVLLKENGTVLFEIGEEQGEAVKALLEEKDFKECAVIKDMYGNNRIVKAVK